MILTTEAVLEEFCNDIEAVGGIVKIDEHRTDVNGQDWPDLAQTYLKACEVLKRKPIVEDAI